MNRKNNMLIVSFGCFLMCFVVIGVSNSPLSLFIVPVTEFFGFSRGAFTLLFTLMSISGLIVSLSFGALVNKFGIRALVSCGVLLAPITFLVFYTADSLTAFYAGGLLLGIVLGLASITSISIIIYDWYDKGQGTMLGVISAGSGLGGALFSLIIGNYIKQNGFQAAFLLSFIILAVIALPLILMIRSNPAHKKTPGQEIERIVKEKKQEAANPHHSSKSFIKKSSNLLALFAVFLIGFVIQPILVNTPAYLVEKGFDSVFAAGVSGSIFLVLAIAKIILGIIHDKFGIKISLFVGLGAFIISTASLLLAANKTALWIFVGFYGFVVASYVILVPLFAQAILGKDDYNSYLGIFMGCMGAGTGIGIPLMSYTYDILGSYSWSIIGFAALGIIAFLLAIISLISSVA
ncbi:MFS transporter [Desulfitobacterium hafniense]|uniref:Major facilitator superfamily (MFS) profile domain-containing protein n=1 Tax=Desulfitobacterium hafniense (strain Y51) TaxID=138119 RepID=Q24Z90_DESHY|nr:MFS transporter [Desulfitobacterium hafniense]BAE82652.1 hypothetical protein DSY0863 [Desulfitobacterium hafniense Y51]